MDQYFIILLLFSLGINQISSSSSAALKPICRDNCVRYVQGYDITGVTNTVQYTFKLNHITSACDCYDKCRQNPTTCANWVWKFTNNSPNRTCTIYSNFNLPSAVRIGFNLTTSKIGNFGGNPLQKGGLVPPCQFYNKQGKPYGHDQNCISGPLWAIGTKQFLC